MGSLNGFPWTNTRVLVTGGAGFIGSTLVKRLVELGSDVSVIDSLWRGNLRNLETAAGRTCIDIKKRFQCADLTDPAECRTLINGFDLVYHLADVVGGVEFALSNQSFVFHQNVLMNTNVVAACARGGIGAYVYVGTACSYPKSLQMADGIVALSEEQAYPAEPESSYGWSKLMGEYEARLLAEANDVRVGVLRLHNVYGPHVECHGDTVQAIPALIMRAARYPEEPFVVWGSGEQYRDFVYVEDVVDALVREAEVGLGQDVIQIGTGRAVSLREAAELIVEISGKRMAIDYDLSKPEGDRGRIAVCERAKRLLGWTPRTPLREGITLTYEWVKRQLCQSQ